MAIIFGFLPVLVFLACLFILDSFKLVRVRNLIFCLAWGVFAALPAYLLNSRIAEATGIDFETLSGYVAPVIEEVLKALLVFLLVARRQAGFLIDAAVYGFAVGAGFALAENLWFYLQAENSFSVVLSVVRGFGTAVMHGGATSICAIILTDGIHRNRKAWMAAGTGLIAAIMIHSGYNHFFLNPLIQTLSIVLILPVVFYLVFLKTTSHLQQWLEVAFSSEIDMLRMIRQGKFSGSKPGQYLKSLKEHFEPVVLVDMYCYIELYLELSIAAKRNMMLRENGFPPIPEPGIKAKLTEFKQLRKLIGKTGELAMLPLVHMQQRELWELNQLENI